MLQFSGVKNAILASHCSTCRRALTALAVLSSLIEAIDEAKAWCGLIAAAGLLSISPPVHAAKTVDKEYVSIESLYYGYVAGGGSAKPTSNLDLELNLRLQSVFSLTAVFSNFTNPDPSQSATQLQVFMRGYGGGMKVDFPGFFFLFGNKSESLRDGKIYPVNTYMFGQLLIYDYFDISAGTKAVVSVPRYGVGMTIFAFNPYSYFETRFALFNLLGSTYVSPGLGVGVNF